MRGKHAFLQPPFEFHKFPPTHTAWLYLPSQTNLPNLTRHTYTYNLLAYLYTLAFSVILVCPLAHLFVVISTPEPTSFNQCLQEQQQPVITDIKQARATTVYTTFNRSSTGTLICIACSSHSFSMDTVSVTCTAEAVVKQQGQRWQQHQCLLHSCCTSIAVTRASTGSPLCFFYPPFPLPPPLPPHPWAKKIPFC